MKRILSKGWLGVILVVAMSGSPAKGIFSLLSFNLNYLGVYQTGGSSHSAQLAWAPKFDLGVIGLRGDLGISPLKNSFGDGFMALNYEALVCLPFTPLFEFQFGGGLATWLNNGGTHLILSGDFVVDIPGDFLDRIFVGYSRFFLPGAGANELKVGIGINL